ncbi:MAG: radical SAM protein [Syntrophales bacterium]|nr:radical SAM protein [Syntrophales bacterium]
MKVLLISANTEKINMPTLPLGLASVAEVAVLDLMFEKDTRLVIRGAIEGFYPDVIGFPSSYAREICRLILTAGLSITWRCILYPLNIDEELVKSMAKAGCREVSLGFESGSERILSLMNKRFKPEDVRRISGMLTEHGIRQMGFLLLGGPGETKETIEDSLNFADSLRLDALKITIGVRIYPYTAVAKISIEEGLIFPRDNLLLPRFYLTRGLEGWLSGTLKDWVAARPHWMFQV